MGEKSTTSVRNIDTHGSVAVEKEIILQEPALYKVLMHNDDHTPMDFVVMVLEKFFHKSYKNANDIMLQVHNSGFGVCGIYTYEIAETKVAQVTECAREHEHPLKCTMDLE